MLSISYARRVAISLPARRRAADGSSSRRRGRLPLAVLTVACLTAVGTAVSAAGAAPPGLSFAQVGHWIANPRQGMVFHVNGAGGVDAQALVPGLAPDSQAVQGPVSGYVVGPRSITPYGMDDLRVEPQIPAPAVDETPVAIEARGGPYLIYRKAGSVVRLGDERPTVKRFETRLGEPAVTRDGTLWLHLPDRNRLCHLAPEADTPTCVAETGPGHRGALTVVGDRAAFVDLDDDTIAPLDAGGLGRPRDIGLDLPADALVARCDVHGRVAVVDRGTSRLHLLDAVGLGTEQPAAAPVSVRLPAGDQVTPMAGRSSVVVLDRAGHRLSVYDVRTRRLRVQALPAEGGTPRLSRGEDEQVYVDGGEGEHLLVVDDAGRVTPVRLGDGSAAAPGAAQGAGGQPAPPPGDTVRPEPAADTRNRPAGDPTPPTGGQPRPAGSGSPGPGPRTPAGPEPVPPGPVQPGPNAPGPDRPGPDRPGPDEPGPDRPGPDEPGPDEPVPTLPTPMPATPPGMPSALTAVAGSTDVVVNWAAAADNGAAIEAYQVTWTPATHGGAVTVDAKARSTTLAGLVPTTSYTITVTARNSVGRGTPRSVQVVSPSRSMFTSRGAPTTWAPDCFPPDCTFVNLELRGFPPNTDVDIVPWTDEWGQFNGGATLTTDDEGTLIVDDRFPCNNVRHYVWLVVDGIATNRVYWSEA